MPTVQFDLQRCRMFASKDSAYSQAPNNELIVIFNARAIAAA